MVFVRRLRLNSDALFVWTRAWKCLEVHVLDLYLGRVGASCDTESLDESEILAEVLATGREPLACINGISKLSVDHGKDLREGSERPRTRHLLAGTPGYW